MDPGLRYRDVRLIQTWVRAKLSNARKESIMEICFLQFRYSTAGKCKRASGPTIHRFSGHMTRMIWLIREAMIPVGSVQWGLNAPCPSLVELALGSELFSSNSKFCLPFSLFHKRSVFFPFCVI